MFLSPHLHFRALLMIACVASLGLAAQTTLFAQENEGSSPLELGRRVVPDVIGIIAGPGFNVQNGSFVTDTCQCKFNNGVGAGLVVGLMYEKNLLTPNATWRLGTVNIGARLMYENRNINAAFREYETLSFRSPTRPELSFSIPTLFRHLAELNFSMITLSPYVAWNPLSIGIFQPFVQVGLQGGLIVNSRLRHTISVLEPEKVLPNGERSTASIQIIRGQDTTYSDRKVLQDNDITNRVNTVQIAANIAVGTDIPFGTRFRLSPMLNYVIPLTQMLSSPTLNENFSISSWQVLVALKMTLER